MAHQVKYMRGKKLPEHNTDILDKQGNANIHNDNSTRMEHLCAKLDQLTVEKVFLVHALIAIMENYQIDFHSCFELTTR